MARNNQKVVPQASAALDRFKFEIATEVGVSLKEGYNGDITARDAGRIGGQMVKRLIETAERNMAGTTGTTITGTMRTRF
ncbi:MAG TPA: alpha/beta-type small acid-soluble spore protein [Clostridia bacterium]|nr:alpha/beta-type small acid-soluble spore protein [Clostridia bacterium]